MSNIHPTAIIHQDAKIAESAIIAPYVIIDENVEIGENTRIDSHAIIRSGARIGNDCKIFTGAVISEVSQDLKFRGEDTITVIGNNTTIREYATIHRGTADKWKTVIGDNCLIMGYVHVAHDVIMGNNIIVSNATQIAGHAEVGDYAIISGMVGVHQFVKIGAHSFIGGGFRVGKDVPPYILVAGEPLQYRGLNTVGLKRRGFTQEQFDTLKSFYRIFFRSKYNITAAIQHVEENFEFTEETRVALEFIKGSTRGLI